MNKSPLTTLVVAAMLVAACSSTPSGATPTPEPSPSPNPSPSQPPPAGLDGRQFLSVSVTQDGAPRPLVPGTQVRLSFSDGNISAQAGCNIFGGSYSLDGDQLVIVGGAMTEMGCAPPRDEQDMWLFGFLGSRPTLQLNGDDLLLTSASTVISLLDREVAEPDRPLVGPTWVLTSIFAGDAVMSAPLGVSPTIAFGPDGRVDIFPGCNSGGGRYSVDGDRIVFAALVMTEMACAGAAGQVEVEVIAVLAADEVRFTIDADSLTLMAGDRGLGFIAQ